MKIDLTLPELPYDRTALNPIITEETFDYHYGKHHATYVNNLSGLVKDTPLVEASVEHIIQHAFEANNAGLFNNAAQHWNHSFFGFVFRLTAGKHPPERLQN